MKKLKKDIEPNNRQKKESQNWGQLKLKEFDTSIEKFKHNG
jgi:hypothetical protein